MLGSLRFLLALFVVIAHLTGGMPFFSHWGGFAVFGFYMISGYLITLILNETYHFRLSAFALNRFLRLFPIYYIVAIVTAFIIAFSNNASEFHPAWKLQTRWIDILGNSLIIPFEFYNSSFRLVPPTWSVAVELINYFILWAIGARSRALAILLFLVAFTYHLASFLSGAGWGQRYSPFYAALLPFSVGAIIYFFQNSIIVLRRQQIIYLSRFSCTIWLGNLVLCGFMGGLNSRFFELFSYINLCSLAIFLCTNIRPPSSDAPISLWDKRLGDLAYPVFLTHWVVGFVVGQVFLDGQHRGLLLFTVSLLPIIAISYALSEIADRMIEPLRNKVRSGLKS
ncbi:acyltransferase [Acidovorax sp. ACV01]|uniref:acyltransferase family protein n=1 Tax=Acidovorax sp. ACV01 TaxID=2769311 RepID=UPI00178350BB|nr:acyltransferase [Acidovorax sp. ACV01]MBD9392868.1 acyltransferase [Acidovorax sp. ACV01]